MGLPRSGRDLTRAYVVRKKDLGDEPRAGRANAYAVKEIGDECSSTGGNVLVDEAEPPRRNGKMMRRVLQDRANA